MKVSITGMTRGEGVCYFELEVEGAPDGASYTAKAALGGRRVPACLLESPGLMAERGQARLLVVVPLFMSLEYELELSALVGGRLAGSVSMRVGGAMLKWFSRLDKPFNDRVRKAELRDPIGHLTVSVASCVPLDDGGVVARVRCRIPGRNAPEGFEFSVLGANGEPIDIETFERDRMFLENSKGCSIPHWELGYSVIVPANCELVCFCASDPSGALQDGFRSLERGMTDVLLGDFYRLTLDAYNDPAYDAWFRQNRAGDAVLAVQSETALPRMPLVSVIVPLYKTPPAFFADMYASVACQSYANWELVLVNASPEDKQLAAVLAGADDKRVRIVALEGNRGIVGNIEAGIEAASGEFLSFLDHDDFLEPDALFEYVKAINDNDCDVLYCDEDSWSAEEGFSRAHFKTDFNRDLLYTHNYVTHFLMIRADLVRQVGPCPSYVEGAQDYDLLLRVIEKTDRITHLPRVLYHWRSHAGSTSVNSASKEYAWEAGRRALSDHFARRGIAVEVEYGQEMFTYTQRYGIDGQPLVSIVIPSKDHIGELDACIGSILEKSTYANYEIVVVENNSTERETFAYYDEITKDARVRVVRYDGSFNYSKVINFGVKHARGEYLLLLNNDTEVITPDFIERLLGRFARPEVGVVGAKLLYADGTVQHAGVITDYPSGPWHMFADVPDSFRGYMGRANFSQNYFAVTGACQMVSRDVYEKVGGYDDEFEVAYGDIDFCNRVWDAGYVVVYDAQTKLHHKEFTSRGRDVGNVARIRAYHELALYHSRYPRYSIEGDPFGNPNLERKSVYGALIEEED